MTSLLRIGLAASVALSVFGCETASKRASADKLPPLDVQVLGATPASDELEALARQKTPGKDNMLFVLTFAEAPPKDLLTSWGTLEYAFARLADRGIRYMPWDALLSHYEEVNSVYAAPVQLAPGAGIAVNGRHTSYVIRPAGPRAKDGGTVDVDREVTEVARNEFKDAFEHNKNRLGSVASSQPGRPLQTPTNPEFFNLRMSLNFDRDLKTSNQGVILRALAKVGTEDIEPSAEISNEITTGKITVQLGALDADGVLTPYNVIVTADVVKLGADDRFGLIVSSNGGYYYDKATVSHGIAGAVNEAVGHAVFVLLCKHMGLDYRAVMEQTRRTGGLLPAAPPLSGQALAAPGDVHSVYPVTAGTSHRCPGGMSFSVAQVDGNSLIVDIAGPNAQALDHRRMRVGDAFNISDETLNESRQVQLVEILYGTTGRFRETLLARK